MNLFTRHPATVDETYFQHALFAGRMGGLLVAAGAAALVHAVLPFAFESTASRLLDRLQHQMASRHSVTDFGAGLTN
mgnify:CR=1 FL=1